MDPAPQGETPEFEIGSDSMNSQSCGKCRYFATSRSCYDQPIWGHCTWPVQDDEEYTSPNGRFTWTDDTCEHFTARHEVIAQS